MPELYDVALVVDGELGRRAIQAVDEYLKEYGDTEYRAERDWPISRSQIAGLRQIAATEPSKVASFASHQQKKVEKRLEQTRREERQRELEAQIAFWKMVKGLCEGKPPRAPWSLAQECDQAMPPELREELSSPDAKPSAQERTARKQTRRLREHWQDAWRREIYPAFFGRFCVHYLYALSKRTKSTQDQE